MLNIIFLVLSNFFINRCFGGSSSVLSGAVRVVTPEASGKSFTISCGGGGKIKIIGAIYGGNCPLGGTQEGSAVAQICDDKTSCNYSPNLLVIGDPCWGVPKDFFYAYQCISGNYNDLGYEGAVATVLPEATGRSLNIYCAAGKKIEIIGAIYGGNCPLGGAQEGDDLALACDGNQSCTYTVNILQIGDPCWGIIKDYFYAWQCR